MSDINLKAEKLNALLAARQRLVERLRTFPDPFERLTIIGSIESMDRQIVDVKKESA